MKGHSTATKDQRRLLKAQIRKLEIRASSGLWVLALFTLISIGASREFSFLPELSPAARDVLGPSPPADLISVALVAYSLSAIVLALYWLMSESRPGGSLAHLGFLTAFYVFYYFSETLKENFWAVFVAGMTILGLKSYHLWNYYSEQQRIEEQNLAALEKEVEEG